MVYGIVGRVLCYRVLHCDECAEWSCKVYIYRVMNKDGTQNNL